MVYRVRAVYHDGVLSLLDPLDLPEGARVQLEVEVTSPQIGESQGGESVTYPTRLVPAERLEDLTGLIALGGDALAESEALYETDCP